MDLRQLEMFQAIVEAGSFTNAGKRLHVSQSAISRQITLLEKELGVQVLMRSNKRVFLTDAGKTLLKHCQLQVLKLVTVLTYQITTLKDMKMV